MVFESYPQLILIICIQQSLQIHQTQNIISCAISAISVVYGFGDHLAFVANDNEAGTPLKLTVLGMYVCSQ